MRFECLMNSAAEPYHFEAALAPGNNFDMAPALVWSLLS
jgi:hypothetical protein